MHKQTNQQTTIYLLAVARPWVTTMHVPYMLIKVGGPRIELGVACQLFGLAQEQRGLDNRGSTACRTL